MIHMNLQFLCRPITWIPFLELLSCLPFATYRPPRHAVWHFVILLSSYTYKGHGHPQNPSVNPWGSMDPRLRTTVLGALLKC